MAEIDSKNCENKTEMSVSERIRFACGRITIEPMVVCYVLPSMLLVLSVQNLNIEKACVANLKYNETVCAALRDRNINGFEM